MIDGILTHASQNLRLGLQMRCVVGSQMYVPMRMVFVVCTDRAAQRNLHPNPNDTKAQLLERVKANLRVPRK